MAEFHLKVEAQLKVQSKKLEELSIKQAAMVQTDEGLQKQIDIQAKRVADLETQVKEIAARPTTSVNSTQVPVGNSQRSRFVPETIVFDKFCKFEEKDAAGADYPEVEQIRANWRARLQGGPSAHLVEYLDMAIPDMNFAGTALSFSLWFPEAARPRLPELVASFQRLAHEPDLAMKGRKIARVQLQKSPGLKTRQERAGIVLCGLEAVIASRPNDDPVWVPNVFFGGAFSVLVGHVAQGAVPDSFGRIRPTVGQKLLGTVSEEGTMQWRNPVVQSIFQMDGEDIEALGIENRKR